uniref:Uncharacterized protein n=1 Tax=Podoviridae sp. ctZih56 TaxID=2827741 RepID=A0A8S5SF52_9CAUD|nr:MAG TPA: hypothetical protein [Podoviridae sp. ctZih56]
MTRGERGPEPAPILIGNVDEQRDDHHQEHRTQGDGKAEDPFVLVLQGPLVHDDLCAKPVDLWANEVGIPGKDPEIVIQGHVQHLAHGPGEIDGGGMGLAGKELGQRGGGDPGLVGDRLDRDAALIAPVAADIVECWFVRQFVYPPLTICKNGWAHPRKSRKRGREILLEINYPRERAGKTGALGVKRVQETRQAMAARRAEMKGCAPDEEATGGSQENTESQDSGEGEAVSCRIKKNTLRLSKSGSPRPAGTSCGLCFCSSRGSLRQESAPDLPIIYPTQRQKSTGREKNKALRGLIFYTRRAF